MSRFRPPDASGVEALADRIGLDLLGEEATGAVERIEAFRDVYAGLQRGATDDSADAESGEDTDRYHSTPEGPDEDPYNAWLARFSLDRDADGPLSGIEVAVKDNVAVRGVELTCGSLAFDGVVPGNYATVVDRLLDAGARIVGKTNMDELAFGPTSETSAFGPTEHPGIPGHVAGGSSSGSAAAVAAGEVDLALGTDTGGSVRIPASYCGIVGIKPTFGAVPVHGVVPMAPSMDHVGTLARDVETAARGLEVIAGTDGLGGEGADPESLSVGVADGFFGEHVSDPVERTVRSALDRLDEAGATVRDLSIPELEGSRAAWWGIAPPEFAATFAHGAIGLNRRGRVEPTLAAATSRVGRSSADLGPNAKEMLVLGAHLLENLDGSHYVRAANRRERLRRGFDRALETVDVLAAPSTPTTALELGGFERGVTPPVNWDTHPANLTGHPAISLPCGEVDGLPVGLQFVGRRHAEAAVIGAASAFESL